MSSALQNTALPLSGKRTGKVRDIYDITLPDESDSVLIISTDRVSSFDVVMQNGVPGRGAILTQISKFWFEMFKDTCEHHLISTDANDIAGLDMHQQQFLKGRVMLCKKTNVIPIECVVRGYVAGSGWKEYQNDGTICGIQLPEGLSQCEELPEPIFTPATKAEEGHDENISFERASELVGEALMTKLRDLSISIYSKARAYAIQHGIIIADTKFEWGLPLDDPEGDPILIDEILTPDSSRFWPLDDYVPGRDQNSFDKQIVRNYLQSLCDNGQWDKTPPGPELPEEVINQTLEQYLTAYEKLTGISFDSTLLP